MHYQLCQAPIGINGCIILFSGHVACEKKKKVSVVSHYVLFG